jgi:hypothetical protein
MGFLVEGVTAADARREDSRQTKLAQLDGKAITIGAGNETESMSAP